MNAVVVRRAAIFSALAGLGVALAFLLGKRTGDHEVVRPTIPVVAVPPGTSLQGAPGVPGISVTNASGVILSEVREIVLAGGTKVPFRPMRLQAASESHLPDPAAGVRRVSLVEPALLLLPIPRTKEQYAASANDRPTRMRSPAGILDQGPGEAKTIRGTGGARVDMEKDGTPWTLAGEEIVMELPSRNLSAPCPVTIDSPILHARGRTLRASDEDGTILLEEGTSGTLTRSGGVRIGGNGKDGDGETRFACSGPFRIFRLVTPAAGPALADGLERFRITLDRDAFIEQGDGRLSGPHLEVDIARAPGDRGKGQDVEAVRGEGGVALSGGSEGRDIVARGEKVLIRPRRDQSTEVHLDGKPTLDVRETAAGVERRVTHVAGTGPAGLVLPPRGEDGAIAAEFRGGAAADVVEPPEREGLPPVRRRLTAKVLSLDAVRSGKGARTDIREVRAVGDADLTEGDRRSRSRFLTWTPAADGSSRTFLQESVSVTWPSAGLLDPLSSIVPGKIPSASTGFLTLAAPREVVILSPPKGDATTGTTLSVKGGAVLRRIAEEQEIYRLTCGHLDAALQPGNRGISRLDATVDPRLQGREEGPGGRRYDFRGERLTVLGAPGSSEARIAEITGTDGRLRAFASFVGDDGKPMDLLADRLRFDRVTGSFRAEGTVRGTGILPESGGGSRPVSGGRTEIACRTMDGVLVQGGTSGASRLRSLAARDDVWLKTETQYASGTALDWDGAADAAAAAVLRGDPARVLSRTPAVAADLKLEDSCEAPELRIRLQDGRLLEARAERDGRFVCHRVVAAAEGKEAPPPERDEGRCRGPLAYRPGETTLEGAVSIVRSVLVKGAFVERDRLENADRVRVLHPPAADGSAGHMEQAVAESDTAALKVVSTADWTATGVSRATLSSTADTVILESSPRYPRFRVEGNGTVQGYRRMVFDYARGMIVEQVGATVEGGR